MEFLKHRWHIIARRDVGDDRVAENEHRRNRILMLVQLISHLFPIASRRNILRNNQQQSECNRCGRKASRADRHGKSLCERKAIPREP